MTIQEKIGQRISEARKKLGMSITELASKTNEFSAQRISNWERGTRSPGPLEARVLADNLQVSASYLLCLTDNPLGEQTIRKTVFRSIPVLDLKDALHAEDKLNHVNFNHSLDTPKKCIMIEELNYTHEKATLFAVILDDDSMSPDFKENELIVVDAHRQAKPGHYVLAYLNDKEQILLRQYREINNALFQLLASNPLWATIDIKNKAEATILGVVIEHRRFW